MSFGEKNLSDTSQSRGRHLLDLINDFSKDSITTNALLLFATWCMNAAVGFFFILIAARMYSINSVGISMLLIAYASIIVLFTRFGIEQSLIRYYADEEKSAIYCSTVLATTLPAALVAALLCVISFFGFLGPDILSSFSAILILVVVFLSVNEVTGFFFLAKDKPFLYLAQSIVVGLRLLFLILLVPFGTLGIFASLGLATGLSMLFSLAMARSLGIRFVLDGRKFLIESFHYSAGNYLSDFFQTAPVYIIPILVFLLFGETETAIYSVGYAIASIAFLVPTAIGYATFIAGCREDLIESPATGISILAFLFLLSIILTFYFWGKDIIQILGSDYVGISDLVVIIMSASIFAFFFQKFSAEFKIQRAIRKLLLLNACFFFTLIALSYVCMIYLGILGAGYAWVVAYIVCVVPILAFQFVVKRNLAIGFG